MAKLIDGKARAKEVRLEVGEGARAFLADHGRPPGLAIVQVGEDPASTSYIRSKERGAAEAAVLSEVHHLTADTREDVLVRFVRRLTEDEHVDGVLVQLPLPDHIDPERILAEIPAAKDVDGLTLESQGRLMAGEQGLRPCTPSGVMDLLHWSGVTLRGRRAAVVGRSRLVGLPAAVMLVREDATVTVLHSRSENLEDVLRQADVVVMAAGKPGLLTPSMVKPGAAVIDVGIHRIDGRITGDADPSVAEVAGLLTPVPGGVGPMTVAMLLKNTLEAARWRS